MGVYKLSGAGSVKTRRTLYTSMNAGNDFGRAMVPIASVDIGTNSSFTFSSIPQTYQDLFVVVQTRTSQPGNSVAAFFVWANGDESSATGLYSQTGLQGDGSSATSSRQSSQNQAIIGLSVNNGATAGIFASIALHVLNYTNTSTFKTFLGRSAADLNGSGTTYIPVALRRSTSAITQLYFRADGGYGHVSGSTATLYGIRAV
jgi:hypothetical protein